MALGKLTDTELIALLKQGDEGAFAVLYDRFRPLIHRYALRISKSDDAAGEIVQNVMLKVWLQREHLDSIQNVKGWISRVTANESFDFLRHLSRDKLLAERVWSQMQEEQPTVESQYVLKEYLHFIEDAIRTLPPQQQRIYRLSREQYLTYDQIAEELHISSNTVRNHMAAALDNIRKYLAGHALHSIPPAIALILFSTRS